MDSCEEKVIKGTSFNSKPRQRTSTNFDSIIHIRLETISYDEKTPKTATLKISNGENRRVKSKAVKFHGPVGEIRADVDIHHYKEDGDELLIVLLDGKAVLARGTLSLAEIQPDKVNSKNIEMKTASILSGKVLNSSNFIKKLRSTVESWRAQACNFKNRSEKIRAGAT